MGRCLSGSLRAVDLLLKVLAFMKWPKCSFGNKGFGLTVRIGPALPSAFFQRALPSHFLEGTPLACTQSGLSSCSQGLGILSCSESSGSSLNIN